jgi:hypothetical protein
MKKNVDYNLLVQAERIRYQSDFSSAHWLHQVISDYERGIEVKIRREAFESVLRTAINLGCKAAIKLANTFPVYAGFPQYLKLSNQGWKKLLK